MIELKKNNKGYCLILQPNCSADWQMNRQIILAVGLVSAVVALGFAAIGAWLILPFAGLEMLALGSALYWVNRHQHHRHILWLEQGLLRIEKGYRWPSQSWQWPVEEVALHVSDDDLSSPLCISLCQGSSQVEIGEFLTREDSQQLISTLRTLGLATRGYSHHDSWQA
ncbi:putative membrane protein [Litorivivens lipolytica]|uniref:Putative membrane protein n=1 Tax=Litorivivens lipolytica TaxID=1524264 RepID=A0A7W4W3R1_9GAMM|nr:putative membrane protein [Litorivivens lipolytica]